MVLITINSLSVYNLSNLAYLLGWKRWLDRYAGEFPDCDFVFVNNGFLPSTLQAHLNPWPIFNLREHCAKWLRLPFDTENSYWPIKKLGHKYSHVLRIDHDAFPPVESLKAIVKYGQQADFVSASNFPRPIEHDRTNLKELDNRFIPPPERKKWQWLPWGYPTHNSDLYMISMKLFNEVEKLYNQDIRISRVKPGVCPFGSSVLTYGQICNILGYKEERYENTEDVRVHIDGSIDSDWWTYMCSVKPKYFGIVDKGGGSFWCKNHILAYPQATSFPSFWEAKDQNDTSFPHSRNIEAPYFHLGNGYLSEWYLEPHNPRQQYTKQSALAHFTQPFGAYAAHYVITSMFAEKCQEGSLQSMKKIVEEQIIQDKDRAAFKELEEKIRSFYTEAIKEYL